MPEDELHSKVDRWLRKTGFPLEMRVARQFQALGEDDSNWIPDANVSYPDSKTGVPREVDLNVYAFVRNDPADGVRLAVELVIECKSTSSPWVILKRRLHSDLHTSPMLHFRSWSNRCIIQAQKKEQLNPLLGDLIKHMAGRVPILPDAGYGIAEAFKDANQRDAAYAAARQVISAMESVAKYSHIDNIGQYFSLAWFVPVLITTSPLFEAALNESGELVTQMVDCAVVDIANDDGEERSVVVLSEQSLPEFISELRPVPFALQEFLASFNVSRLEKKADLAFQIVSS